MRETQNSLNAAFKTGDRATICSAINAMVFAADNVRAFALKAGVDRTTLYRAFKGNPRLDVVLKILSAANFKLVVVVAPDRRSRLNGLISKRLSSAFETEEIRLIVDAFSKTLRAQDNVVAFAKKANVSREALYRSFTVPRVPSINTALCFLNALGLRLSVS